MLLAIWGTSWDSIGKNVPQRSHIKKSAKGEMQWINKEEIPNLNSVDDFEELFCGDEYESIQEVIDERHRASRRKISR